MGLGSALSSSKSSALQKAIERNRKKQQVKQSTGLGGGSTSSSSRLNSLRSQLRSGAPSKPSVTNTTQTRSNRMGVSADSVRSRLGGLGGSSRATTTTPKTTRRATRLGVANADNTTFSTPLRKSTTKSPSVNYRTTTRRSTTKKVAAESVGLIGKFFINSGWLLSLFLLGRLIFADRGIIDYYKKENLISGKIAKKNALIQENEDLKIQLQRLANDSSFQKKTVRDHLGVIAKDEYLVLFAREVETSKSASFQP